MPKKGKRVVITSLAVRFYLGDGWLEWEFDAYLSKGRKMQLFNDPSAAYWLMPPSGFDLIKFYNDGLVSEVACKDEYGETKEKSDLEALKARVF